VLSLYHLCEKSWILHHHPASAFVRDEMAAVVEVTAVPEVMAAVVDVTVVPEVTAVPEVMAAVVEVTAVPEIVSEEWQER
jgi:hypothetical protein